MENNNKRFQCCRSCVYFVLFRDNVDRPDFQLARCHSGLVEVSPPCRLYTADWPVLYRDPSLNGSPPFLENGTRNRFNALDLEVPAPSRSDREVPEPSSSVLSPSPVASTLGSDPQSSPFIGL
ncbi:unnamed protein product [Coregonus sp. 'balchen']|nr:unnamed protein product [Coregonus sp. 'balchen']